MDRKRKDDANFVLRIYKKPKFPWDNTLVACFIIDFFVVPRHGFSTPRGPIGKHNMGVK